MSPAVQKLAVSAMSCTSNAYDVYNGGTVKLAHDQHLGVPVDYFWHSTVSGNRFGHRVDMTGYCQFLIKIDGKVGSAELDFRFSYEMSDAGIDRGNPIHNGAQYTTTLRTSLPSA